MNSSIRILLLSLVFSFQVSPIVASEEKLHSFFEYSKINIASLMQYAVPLHNVVGKYSSFCLFGLVFYLFHKKANKSTCDFFKMKYKKLSTKLKEAEKRMQEGNDAMEKLIKDFNSALSQIQISAIQINTVQDTTEKIKTQLSTVENNIKDTNTCAEDLKKTCVSILEKVNIDETKLDSVEKEMKRVQTLLDDVIAQSALLEMLDKEYKGTLNTFKKELEDNITHMKTINNQIISLNTTHETMQNTLGTIQEDTKNMKNNLEKTDKQNNEIKKLVIARYNETKSSLNLLSSNLYSTLSRMAKKKK